MNEVDQYISQYPEELQAKLQEIRHLIRKTAPMATEKISWNMPTFYHHGNLVHYAMNKAHIGFYPGASGVENFISQLGEYKHSKGTIQFHLNKPLPEKLITEIVKFRIEENTKKYKEKATKK
ncbi:iron chaperone [Bacillus sp. JJ722]|uniref:iron chaperone n=1 Tax=Bacillus sp. JJ722 TaxID=3122973 RepID=UPI002FFD9C15